MKSRSRILVAISALLMLSAYFFPLWQIQLEAPQYPEGLGMKIWLNNITGNVDQINGLNHYIGMKHIVVDEFVEFKILPYIFAVIILIGLLAASTGKRMLLSLWFAVLVVFAIIGLTDFYIWEYTYGHHLDPMAAIKVPGMNYQPPLIGYKQLLNFVAGSFPDTGGILTAVGGFLAGSVLFHESRLKRKSNEVTN